LRTYSNSDGKLEKHKENIQLRGAVYARVSAPKQRGDLERQIASIKSNCCKNGVKPVKVYYDVASGINDKRKGLKKLLDDAPKHIFDSVWVNYKDRLSRFGSAIIEQYLGSWGVDLHIINSITGDLSPQLDLITDLTAILYSFMGRLYRSRRKSKINVKNSKTV
jgi:predicted site-specific integrase-resolvase